MQPNVKNAHRTEATLKDDGSHRDQFWPIKSYILYFWSWELSRRTLETYLAVCVFRLRRSNLYDKAVKRRKNWDVLKKKCFETGRRPRFHQWWQAIKHWRWAISSLRCLCNIVKCYVIKSTYCSPYYWFNLTHLCSLMQIVHESSDPHF